MSFLKTHFFCSRRRATFYIVKNSGFFSISDNLLLPISGKERGSLTTPTRERELILCQKIQLRPGIELGTYGSAVHHSTNSTRLGGIILINFGRITSVRENKSGLAMPMLAKAEICTYYGFPKGSGDEL